MRESDILREMLLIAGDVNEIEKKWSALRNKIALLDTVSEYTEEAVPDIEMSLNRVKLEFAQAVNWLAEKNKDFS
jgi:hypothetical protein